MVNLPLFTPFLGEEHLLAGHLDEALSVARQALALARDRKERGHEAWALRLRGEIHAHRDPPETEVAEGYYREALALADELGMRPLLATATSGWERSPAGWAIPRKRARICPRRPGCTVRWA